VNTGYRQQKKTKRLKVVIGWKMRFICDICPLTATTGQTVIIGNYDAWIKHLLTPPHQTEQNLAMKRRSCWTEADYTAVVKNLPRFDESSVDLYEDVTMQLSEYGFIEAIFHRKGTESDSLYVAIQLYETKSFPNNLAFIDGNAFSVKLLPKPTMSSFCGNAVVSKTDGNGLGQRRRRLSSSSSGSPGAKLGIAGNENRAEVTSPPSKPFYNVNCPVFQPRPLEKKDFSVQCQIECNEECNNFPVTTNGQETVKDECSEKYVGIRGKRIKYDKNTLLLFCETKTPPQRFLDVVNFPMQILLEEAKVIDKEVLKADVVWEFRDMNIRGNDNDGERRPIQSEWRRRKPNEEAGWTGPMNAQNSWHKTQY